MALISRSSTVSGTPFLDACQYSTPTVITYLLSHFRGAAELKIWSLFSSLNGLENAFLRASANVRSGLGIHGTLREFLERELGTDRMHKLMSHFQFQSFSATNTKIDNLSSTLSKKLDEMKQLMSQSASRERQLAILPVLPVPADQEDLLSSIGLPPLPFFYRGQRPAAAANPPPSPSPAPAPSTETQTSSSIEISRTYGA
jgi:hypothetical protein